MVYDSFHKSSQPKFSFKGMGLLFFRWIICIILNGYRYYYRFNFILAILRILEKHMMEVDFEGIMKIMKNVTDYVTDEEELVAYIYDVSFPKWVYDEIPKLESEFLKQI